MPIAVVRVESPSWPLQVALTDATSMAGQLLSDFGTVSIEAQVSKNGQPGRQNALFWGEVVLPPSDRGAGSNSLESRLIDNILTQT